MGQSKKPKPRKSAAPKLVKWIVAPRVVGAIGYGVSQMSNIAYGEREIKVDRLLRARRRRRSASALEAANAARCTCGCGMTLAQCVATDSTCPIREDQRRQDRRRWSATPRARSRDCERGDQIDVSKIRRFVFRERRSRVPVHRSRFVVSRAPLAPLPAPLPSCSAPVADASGSPSHDRPRSRTASGDPGPSVPTSRYSGSGRSRDCSSSCSADL